MNASVNQIDYGSTSNSLSESQKFTRYSRLSITDRFINNALISLIEHIGWKYVTIIAENSMFGTSGSEDFVHALERYII